MKLVFVCKRAPQQRDLAARPYGRFFSLPRMLSDLGHDVDLLIVGHTGKPTEMLHVNGLRVHCYDLRTMGPIALYRTLMRQAISLRPDWVIAFSDMHFAWLASRMAQSSGARLAIDAYDNFEAYMPWNLPMRWLWRRSLAAADLVIAAGPQLAERLQRSRPNKRTVEILPMCADEDFKPMDRTSARAVLRLPDPSALVGYLGSWGKGRGTEILIEAFVLVRRVRPDVLLVLSGRPPRDVLDLPGVLAVGYLPDDQLPVLTNALNVACVIADDTPFGRYSYPSKLCEAMACGTSVAASGTGPVLWMLGEAASRHAVPLGNAQALAARILELLDSGKADYPVQPHWRQLARDLERSLSR